ncbi:MAG: hypothetical protein K2R98_09025 [Gemmataceae bacterium]|nr:hypothetical protein [Gemmataceae bacterium]
MAKAKSKPYPPPLLERMALKTAVLLKARSFADMGMAETAQPMWAVAASHEGQIAPLLDLLGRDLEAAASRLSAASCYQKGHKPVQRGPPLRANTRRNGGQRSMDHRDEKCRRERECPGRQIDAVERSPAND